MAIEQYSVINYEDIANISKYIKGNTLIPIDELESPIGLRVEGGGYIFYDDTVGFPIYGLTSPANALATRWGVEASYGTYYYDMLRGCVVRESTGTCNRFMVVDETDMVNSPYGSMLLWDTESGASTSRATSTDFGYGSANTTLLAGGFNASGAAIAGVITSNSTIWPTANYSRYRNPNGQQVGDSATDTKWFVPSRDELHVLLRMAARSAGFRPGNSIYSHQLQISFWNNYWSSSEYPGNVSRACTCNFGSGNMIFTDKYYSSSRNRVRLCRTF